MNFYLLLSVIKFVLMLNFYMLEPALVRSNCIKNPMRENFSGENLFGEWQVKIFSELIMMVCNQNYIVPEWCFKKKGKQPK